MSKMSKMSKMKPENSLFTATLGDFIVFQRKLLTKRKKEIC